MNSKMKFGEALELLKTKSARIARSGWNGKGMWVELVRSECWSTKTMGITARHLPWIGMKTADDCFVPWLASQTDILAEDWEVVG